MAAPVIAPERPRPAARIRGRPRKGRTYTHEELFAMEDEGIAFELDAEGHLEDRPMGALSSETGAMVIGEFLIFGKGPRPGAVLGADISLAIWPDFPKRLRRSDVAFIYRDRLPGGKSPSGILTIAPDLVVEVVSPRDIAAVLERKIGEYFAGGVKLVWVIYPEERRALVRRADGTAATVGASEPPRRRGCTSRLLRSPRGRDPARVVRPVAARELEPVGCSLGPRQSTPTTKLTLVVPLPPMFRVATFFAPSTW